MKRKIGKIRQVNSDCKEIVEIVKNSINTSASPLTEKIRKEGYNMDWKVGEIKQVNGEWYQCVEGNNRCLGCSLFYTICDSTDKGIAFGECSYAGRSDNTSVIFKKLEKVGEPYINNDRTYQLYKLPMNIEKLSQQNDGINLVRFDTIEIEIKQNKEDMEAKNNTEQTPLEKLVIDFFNNRITDEELERKVSELYAEHSNSKNIEKNLKPFDLEAAKLGKPVCTRDGRKARIICFDTKGDVCPIIALIEENGIEVTIHYDRGGRNCYKGSNDDLMMLPEKKEGWVNVYKEDNSYTTSEEIYQSKEEAIKANIYENVYLTTVKINWEE